MFLIMQNSHGFCVHIYNTGNNIGIRKKVTFLENSTAMLDFNA